MRNCQTVSKVATTFYILHSPQKHDSNFSTFLSTACYFLFEKTVAVLAGTINIFLLWFHLWFLLLPGRLNPFFYSALTRIYNTVIIRVTNIGYFVGARYYAKCFTCVSSLNPHMIFCEVNFIICILQMRAQAEREIVQNHTPTRVKAGIWTPGHMWPQSQCS